MWKKKKKKKEKGHADCFNRVPHGKSHYFISYNADKATEYRVHVQREINTTEYRGKQQKK